MPNKVAILKKQVKVLSISIQLLIWISFPFECDIIVITGTGAIGIGGWYDIIRVLGQKSDPTGGYNGVAGRNGGSVVNGLFCISGSGTMSKCVDITGVVIRNLFHNGPCGLGENSCAEYPRGLVSSRLSGESSDSLSGITAGGNHC